MAVYLQQLERLRSLRLRAIAPGHGDVIDDPQAKVNEYISHRLARETKVLAALRTSGTATIDELLPVVYDDVPEERHWIAKSSLWAHLRKLEQDGAASSPDRDDIDAAWQSL
jgi:glyoxylase-like metal-dependent hydrolase (beta-lactamase superfamily II)